MIIKEITLIYRNNGNYYSCSVEGNEIPDLTFLNIKGPFSTKYITWYYFDTTSYIEIMALSDYLEERNYRIRHVDNSPLIRGKK